MGLLDIPAPLFAGLDALLGYVLPPTARLIVWGVVAGVLSMLLYRWISPQRRIAHIKTEAVEARGTLNAYDGDFQGAWPHMRRMLRLSFAQVGLVTWPAVVASLPMLCLLVWLSNAYGAYLPAQGAEIAVHAVPETFDTRWVSGGGPAEPQAPHIHVLDHQGLVMHDIALTAPVTAVHKWQWWNALIGNPAGYLPEESPVRRVEVELPHYDYLPFGPPWMRSWEVTFFAVLIIASLAMKTVFRIE